MTYQCRCGVIVTNDGLCPTCGTNDAMRASAKEGWASTVMEKEDPKFLEFCNRVMSLLYEDARPIGRDKPFSMSQYYLMKEKIAQAQTLAYNHGATATETAKEIARQLERFQ